MSLCEVYVWSGLNLRLGSSSRKMGSSGMIKSHILVKLHCLQIVEPGPEGRDWASEKG